MTKKRKITFINDGPTEITDNSLTPTDPLTAFQHMSEWGLGRAVVGIHERLAVVATEIRVLNQEQQQLNQLLAILKTARELKAAAK